MYFRLIMRQFEVSTPIIKIFRIEQILIDSIIQPEFISTQESLSLSDILSRATFENLTSIIYFCYGFLQAYVSYN